MFLLSRYLIQRLKFQISNCKRRAWLPVPSPPHARAHSRCRNHCERKKQQMFSHKSTATLFSEFTCCFSKCSLSAPRLASTRRLLTRVGTCLMLFILPVRCRRFFPQGLKRNNQKVADKLRPRSRIAKSVSRRPEPGVWV